MNCPRNRLTSFLLAIATLLLSNVSFAWNRDDLYKIGKEAYYKQDYVSALKNLYAYYVLNEVEINKHPDFKKRINDSISTSEAKIREKKEGIFDGKADK